jgi:hypothetical protein
MNTYASEPGAATGCTQVSPLLGHSGLQWLNPALKKENHQLCPIELLFGYVFQIQNSSQQWLDFFSFRFRREGIP